MNKTTKERILNKIPTKALANKSSNPRWVCMLTEGCNGRVDCIFCRLAGVVAAEAEDDVEE